MLKVPSRKKARPQLKDNKTPNKTPTFPTSWAICGAWARAPPRTLTDFVVGDDDAETPSSSSPTPNAHTIRPDLEIQAYRRTNIQAFRSRKTISFQSSTNQRQTGTPHGYCFAFHSPKAVCTRSPCPYKHTCRYTQRDCVNCWRHTMMPNTSLGGSWMGLSLILKDQIAH